MNMDITIDERDLLIKLLKKAEEFSVTSYPIDLDLIFVYNYFLLSKAARILLL